MRLIRFAVSAPLFFIASHAWSFGDMNQPGVGAGVLVTVSSLTATNCIKTDADGVEFNANCTAGKVGIGAAVPSAALHVSSGTVLIENNSSGANDLLKMSNYATGTSDYSTWRVVNSSGSTGTFIWYLMGGSFASSNQYLQNSLLWESPNTSNGLGLSAKGTTGAGLNFYVNGTNRMRINNDGIGIGTINPASKLHVSSGTLTLDGNVSPSLTATNAIRPAIKAKADFDALTPALGDTYLCSDCTVPYDICVATGAVLNGFRATILSAISTTLPGTLVPKGCGDNP